MAVARNKCYLPTGDTIQDIIDAAGGGDVTNPMTTNLDVGGYKIIAASGNIEFQVTGTGVIKFTRV